MKNAIETIGRRKSTRTFLDKELKEEDLEFLKEFIENLSNPFGANNRYCLIDKRGNETSGKLGTYGIIKNPQVFIGGITRLGDKSLEALGYELETLVLELEERGIGTCWLGGTFNRGSFAEAAELSGDELLPIIIPAGYIDGNKSFTDKVMRKVSKGDQRKDWNELFFEEDFGRPLSRPAAGAYEEVLLAVRLAPSASNRQPWRIVRRGDHFHFYEYRTPGYSTAFSYDIQSIDMGIAACHFIKAAEELGLSGRLVIEDPSISLPTDTSYSFSYYSFSYIGEGEEKVEAGKSKIIYLAGGCFWGAEKYLSLISGVIATETGYANGSTECPSYEDICRNNSGHAETVKVTYDNEKISLGTLLEYYYEIIDPLSLNRQGNDWGTQYRTGIYHVDQEDVAVIEESIRGLEERLGEKVAIERGSLVNYNKAEEYHQKYLDKNPGGYCHIGPDKFKKALERK